MNDLICYKKFKECLDGTLGNRKMYLVEFE